MMNTSDELRDFQKQVFSEYKTAKSLKESSNRVKEDRQNNKKGCLSVPMLILAEFAINKAAKSERRKKNYAESEREARELLRQKEVSDRVCETIAEISRKEILTEEKFVNNFTAALFRSDLANRFVIPENAVLYALMATEIYKTGLNNYCDDQKGDE